VRLSAGADQVVAVLDRAVVEARDDVAALDAAATRGRIIHHAEHQHTLSGRHLEVFAEVPVEILDAYAESSTPHAAQHHRARQVIHLERLAPLFVEKKSVAAR